MIKQWWDFGKTTDVATEETIQGEWVRARETMQKRAEKYGSSLRNLPLRARHHYGKALANYKGRQFEGEGTINYSFEPDKWLLSEFHIYDEIFRENSLSLYGKLSVTVKEHTELLDIPTDVLEEMAQAKVYRRGGTVVEWNTVVGDILKGINVVPVAVKVNDKDIEISGDNLYMKLTTKECFQCHRPYWQFSNFSGFNLEENLRAGFGTDSRSDVSNDHFGGHHYISSPYEDLLCSPECANVWFSSWRVALKEEAEVRKIVQSLVGKETYDMGEINLGRHIGETDPIWHIVLLNNQGEKAESHEIKRVIKIGLEGVVLEDSMV